ncbi:MAG: hypothetical protein D6816_02440 [Bacteroidetes bacterium]|nr:MAG: hypothetical protein D6816_02440 [Bacteroidota bacterium]
MARTQDDVLSDLLDCVQYGLECFQKLCENHIDEPQHHTPLRKYAHNLVSASLDIVLLYTTPPEKFLDPDYEPYSVREYEIMLESAKTSIQKAISELETLPAADPYNQEVISKLRAMFNEAVDS